MGTRGERVAVIVGALLILLLMLSSVTAHPSGEEPVAQGGTGAAGVVLPLLQYQGRLTDPDTGEPVDDGMHTMTFRLYDDASGSTELWTETKDVQVENGLFNTTLGDEAPLDQGLFDGRELWLGVKVGADGEATPLQPVLPVAYAMGLVPGAQISTTSGSPALGVSNAGAGDALQVDGTTTLDGDLSVSGSLIGGSHTHDGGDVASGTVVEPRIAQEIARDDEVTSAINSHAGDPDAHHTRYTDAEAWSATLANDGSGSGLDADLLDGQDSGDFSPVGHTHTAGDITAGTLSNSRFSAYSDLSSEGYLDNNAVGDLLTRSQADGRYVNEQQTSSIDSAMIANGAVTSNDLADGAALEEILDDDGGGSGLDADFVDGYHAIEIMSSAGSAAIYGSTTSNSVAEMDSFTVDVPWRGTLTVIVMGSAWLDCDATSSASRLCYGARMGICDTSASSAECGYTYGKRYDFQDPDNINSLNKENWITLARTVEVDKSGARTFYLNGQSSASGMTWLMNGYVIAIFTPRSMKVTNP